MSIKLTYRNPASRYGVCRYIKSAKQAAEYCTWRRQAFYLSFLELVVFMFLVALFGAMLIPLGALPGEFIYKS